MAARVELCSEQVRAVYRGLKLEGEGPFTLFDSSFIEPNIGLDGNGEDSPNSPKGQVTLTPTGSVENYQAIITTCGNVTSIFVRGEKGSQRLQLDLRVSSEEGVIRKEGDETLKVPGLNMEIVAIVTHLSKSESDNQTNRD